MFRKEFIFGVFVKESCIGCYQRSERIENVTSLDWESVKSGKKQLPAFKHIEAEHTRFNPKKSKKGVFYENPKEKIEIGLGKSSQLEINPITKQEWEKGVQKSYDYCIVPFENAGYEYSGGRWDEGLVSEYQSRLHYNCHGSWNE